MIQAMHFMGVDLHIKLNIDVWVWDVSVDGEFYSSGYAGDYWTALQQAQAYMVSLTTDAARTSSDAGSES